MEKYGFWISELFECRVKNTWFMIFIEVLEYMYCNCTVLYICNY